jgi:hypothetical protein
MVIAKQRREAAYILSDYEILRKEAKKALQTLKTIKDFDKDYRVKFYANKAYKRIKGYENYNSRNDNVRLFVNKISIFLTVICFILAILLNIFLQTKFPRI